ncbi:MAG TPA: ferritin-like domain-containing protein [Acetobacteraceae bacterium]|nr:ferritin-like domain-containing protein [Acetobacteraceae bacterium]
MAARGFTDPVLELVRLLRESADMEHASLLQYTYSAFSLKPGYEAIGGYDSKDTASLLLIAIEKMKHLGVLNRMLNTLGAAPQLSPPSFPFKSDAYPFSLNLEPLSREALARYIYREAPPEVFDSKSIDTTDRELAVTICNMLGVSGEREASTYAAIVSVAGEVGRSPDTELPDLTRWIDALRLLEARGREARFNFLKELFLGSDPAFAGHGDVWRLPITDPGYPSYDMISNPTACNGQTSRGSDPVILALTRLGNLQYGTVLLFLDLYFRHHLSTYRSLAITHMMGPVRSVGKYLPRFGAGMPFDAIDVSDSSGLDAKHRLRFVLALLQEGQSVAEAIGPGLPPDYPLSVNLDTIAKLREPDLPKGTGSTTIR